MPGGSALTALVSAISWGVGDFSGGMGVKHAGGTRRAALRIVLLSHTTSFVVLAILSFALGGIFPHGRLLAWGLSAGVCAGLSLSAFYVALSRGAMGAAAAVSGLLAAAIPAAFAIVTEGSPGWMRILGFVIAGVAIWLIAAGEGARSSLSTTTLAIGAGAGFGCYFVALKYAGAGGALWAMTTARMGSIAACATLYLILRGDPGKVRGTVLRWVLLTALFDTCGNLLFVTATRTGRLDVAAVLASLYPASTILLASGLLKERLTGRQLTGMAIAVVAVVLITL